MARPSFTHIKTHEFRGVRYAIEWRRPPNRNPKIVVSGDCDQSIKRIRIHPDSDHLELLFNMLHESLHACFFDLEDACIDEWETAAKRFARRMGIKITFEPKERR